MPGGLGERHVMLRMIFCLGIITIGIFASFFGPFYALLFYLWNAYFRPEDWTYGPLIASLQLSWTIGLFLVGSTALSMPKYPLNWRVGLMALFILHTLVGVVTSEHVEFSWNAWIMFGKVVVIAYLIIVLATTRERFRLVLMAIALSLGFEAAKQGWAQLILNPGGVNNNTVSFLGDNNGVALGTMMLVPLFGALAQTAETKAEALGHRFLAVGVFMRGLTTYSRGGFVAAVILGMVGLARSRQRMRYALGVIVFVALAGTVMPQEFWDRISTVTASQEERDDSSAGRLHFWKVAVDMARAKPLTGVGFSGFNASYESYNTDEQFAGERAAHSVWFGLLGDLGFPGLFLFLSVWATGVWSCWRTSIACRKKTELKDVRLFADALLLSLVVFAVAGSFLSVQYGEMFWHFVGLSIALVPLANEAAAPVVAPQPARRVHSHPALAGL